MPDLSLVLVAGYPGSGKTLIGQRISQEIHPTVFLDKDTLTASLAEQLLGALGESINAREGAIYFEKVRPFEYETLMAVSLENLMLGKNVVASAPFLEEVTSPNWVAYLRQDIAKLRVKLKVIWVRSTPDLIHERLIVRNAARDNYKLTRWNEYEEIIKTEVPAMLPFDTFILTNNERKSFGIEVQIEQALHFISL